MKSYVKNIRMMILAMETEWDICVMGTHKSEKECTAHIEKNI